MREFDLEGRLIRFSVQILDIVRKIPETFIGKYFADQLMRSGTSASLNYGEAQSAESRRDFIHKMKVSLKELRETSVCLKIITEAGVCKNDESIGVVCKENEELISIFVKSIATAQRNMENVQHRSRNKER